MVFPSENPVLLSFSCPHSVSMMTFANFSSALAYLSLSMKQRNAEHQQAMEIGLFTPDRRIDRNTVVISNVTQSPKGGHYYS